MYNISDVIRKVMIDKKINVTDLSKKIGVLQSALSRKLQNKTEDYKITYLYNIFKALDCDIQINIIDKSTNDIIYTIQDNNDILL